VAGNQQLQNLRAGPALGGGEDLRGGLALGGGGLENHLYPAVGQELAREEVPNAPERAESGGSGDYNKCWTINNIIREHVCTITVHDLH
jgi:hypothetical protein